MRSNKRFNEIGGIKLYRFLEQFTEHDLTSYRFRDELYFQTKRSLEKTFTDSKTDAIDYAKVNVLSDFILEIYKLGVEVGKGKNYENFKQEAIEEELRQRQFLVELGII